MPQIVKGGKHVFGISEVRENYQMRVPLEAFYEYRLHEGKLVILISGDDSSGGFSLHTIDKLRHSRLSILMETLEYSKKHDEFGVPESSINHYKSRIISWMKLDKNAFFFLSINLAETLRVNVSDKLVVVRGGNNGPGFIVKGPVYEEAILSPDLEKF